MIFISLFQYEPINSFLATAFLFVFVFVFLYYVFGNLKLPYFSKNMPSNLAIWLAIGLAFIMVINNNARELLFNTTPWFGFVLVALVFIFLFLAFVGIDITDSKSKLLSLEDQKMIGFVILGAFLFITFLAISVQFGPFLINTSKNSQSPDYVLGNKGFANMAFAIAFNPYVFGSILFLVIAAVTVYFLTKPEN